MLTVLQRSQHALRNRLLHQQTHVWLRCLTPLSRSSHLNFTTARPCLQRSEISIDAIRDNDSTQRVGKVLVERAVPILCPGCGAPGQTIDSNSPGYYGKKYKIAESDRTKEENAIFQSALERGDLQELDDSNAAKGPEPTSSTPICDRCHNLLYQSTGKSIIHPTTEAIRAIIEESPHKHNHIYHVLDAADFPMSLIPNLTSALHLPRLRTQNRRSKSIRYMRDRVVEVSFIVTRADLLAPQKEQVDRLLPYIQDVLRNALGRTGKNVRLGNVRLVSSKRGWWTKNVKEEIYERGGAGWMVGKVNVGKSALVEVVFPKGRNQNIEIKKLRAESQGSSSPAGRPEGHRPIDALSRLEGSSAVVASEQQDADSDALSALSQDPDATATDADEDFVFDETDYSLLPPAQPELSYPMMPIVSALPGTTASPIRLPYGNNKGELIDLPGIERSSLEQFVIPGSRKAMIMQYRAIPEQQSIKPGQSLLLGGLIRITPKTENLVFLTYGFLPTAMQPHVTSTEKAIAIQTGRFAETGEAYEGGVISNATETAKTKIRSAGTFKLRWDVTKQRAGPVTDKVAGKQQAETLPYIVYALDLLVEGVGWVEIVAQIRRKAADEASYLQGLSTFNEDDIADRDSHLPEIEVFSPNGAFVGVRRPMNGWLLNRPKEQPVHKRRPRPRQSMSYQRRVAGGRNGSRRLLAGD